MTDICDPFCDGTPTCRANAESHVHGCYRDQPCTHHTTDLSPQPCEVCGAEPPDVRRVRIRCADGWITGWLCDDHFRDVEGLL